MDQLKIVGLDGNEYTYQQLRCLREITAWGRSFNKIHNQRNKPIVEAPKGFAEALIDEVSI
jgi:hypothetical protein